MWSVGVVAYCLLTSSFPFKSTKDEEDLKTEIIAGQFIQSKLYKCLPDAISFIVHLLQVNPSERLTATEALKHPWITNC
jgi:serine/threonine protein kinase